MAYRMIVILGSNQEPQHVMQHMAQGQGEHTAYGVFSFDPAVALCMHDAGQIHMLV
jgi:hypothetical protein